METLVRQLLAFLVLVVILGLVVYGIRLALPLLGLPPQVEIIVLIIIAIFVLLAILRYFGFWGSPPAV